MSFFGLVWVASWVGCFFSSSHDLLKAPEPACVLLQPQLNTRIQFNHSWSSARLAVDTVAPTPQPTLPSPATSNRRSQPSTESSNFQLSGWLKHLSRVLLTPPQPSDREAPVSYTAPGPVTTRPAAIFKPILFGLNLISGVPQAPLSLTVTRVTSDAPPTSVKQQESTANRCAPERAAAESPVQAVFQVRVRDYVVAEALTQEQANQIAHRIEPVLQRFKRASGLGQTEFLPAIENGRPVGKLGDQLLFSVDTNMAQRWNCNPEWLAVQWVNNLRSAFEQAPLDLAQAQAAMHGLHETPQRIQGVASWYGPMFHGRQTATGETFDQTQFTAAHPSLPFDTYLKVTNRRNGKSVIVRVNDRGPYVENRVLDLSHEAARSLDSDQVGIVPIEATIMKSVAPATPAGAIARRL